MHKRINFTRVKRTDEIKNKKRKKQSEADAIITLKYQEDIWSTIT